MFVNALLSRLLFVRLPITWAGVFWIGYALILVLCAVYFGD